MGVQWFAPHVTRPPRPRPPKNIPKHLSEQEKVKLQRVRRDFFLTTPHVSAEIEAEDTGCERAAPGSGYQDRRVPAAPPNEYFLQKTTATPIF